MFTLFYWIWILTYFIGSSRSSSRRQQAQHRLGQFIESSMAVPHSQLSSAHSLRLHPEQIAQVLSIAAQQRRHLLLLLSNYWRCLERWQLVGDQDSGWQQAPLRSWSLGSYLNLFHLLLKLAFQSLFLGHRLKRTYRDRNSKAPLSAF